tara:strand:- start:289 stop:585 length:297 start_codon:yes stop_codon:yes gene_type:complete
LDRVDKKVFGLKMLNLVSLPLDSVAESSEPETDGDFLTNLFVSLILSIGLSSVYSAFLQAAVRAQKLESDLVTSEAMAEFIDIGSSLNERFVSKISDV